MSTLRVFGSRDDQLKRQPPGTGGFLDVRVEEAVRLSADRSADAEAIDLTGLKDDDVLEITLDDGLQIWTRWDDLQRDRSDQLTRGDGDQVILPTTLHFGDPSRGTGEWTLTALRKIGFDLPGETAGLVTEALEKRLPNTPGLYQWGLKGEMRPARKADIPDNEPILLFIHGTMSSTTGSFGDLCMEGVRERFVERYGDRIYALEHRTLSESPVQNALELVETWLPANATLHLVTHSRGGLVGELLSRSGRQNGARIDELDLEVFRQRHGQDAHELDRLRKLGALLDERNITVERFVRVGCPAAGTTLASGRLDRYLGVMRNVIGQIPALKASPFYEFVTAFLLAVVKKRADPAEIPGLEAQMPDSPLVAVLNRPDVRVSGDLAVIAGDIEPSGVFARLGVLAMDAFFLADHDLVVNTAAMLGGAGRTGGARAMLTKGAHVNHFSYFENQDSVKAIGLGLEPMPESGLRDGPFMPLEEARGRHRERRFTRERKDDRRPGPRPTVFLVPGLMGSHLSVDGDRIWMDVLDLAVGGMSRLAHDAPDVQPLKPIDRVYGELADFLKHSHEVRLFPYDWRQSVLTWGDHLGREIRKALDASDLPVRIIAHSMGGVVTQAMIHTHPDVWREVTERPGHRVVLMGTPIRGSFTIPLVLLGQEATLRKLAMLDLRHSREAILQIVARYQGLLDLLPDVEDHKMFTRRFWDHLYDGGAGWTRPEADQLAQARDTRRALAETHFGPEPVCYVAGHAPATPSGYRIEGGRKGDRRIRFLATSRGDGRVTWDSGPPPDSEVYYLDGVSHGDLPSHEGAFGAYLELLEEGHTRQLDRTPPQVRSGQEEFELPEIPAELFPDTDDLIVSAIGGTASREIVAKAPEVRVRVAHGDLAFASHPVVVGHYKDDLIVSAEESLDHHMNGLLSTRHAASVYPGDLATASVVFQATPGRKPEGVIVVGLGEVGRLSPGGLTATIAHGLREYVVQRMEEQPESAPGGGRRYSVSSLLVGTGEGGLDLGTALVSILRGVSEANAALAKSLGSQSVGIGEIEFIELFQDRAVEALDTLRTMASEDGSGLRIEEELKVLRGRRRRMYERSDQSWWQRVEILGGASEAGPYADAREMFKPLRFKALTDKARVSQEVVGAQRVLIDEMVKESITRPSWDPELARTLFELLLPNSFKNAASGRRNVELVLDEEAAGYPWELLLDPQGDGDPTAIRAGLVRRLITSASSSPSETSTSNFAFVVGDPPSDLPKLPGASKEARAVADTLRRRGYDVTACIEKGGTRVLKDLFGKEGSGARGYRILHLAGHGVYRGVGSMDSGMVLGPGELLTPSEIERLRFVPELVFINCCHLGRIEGSESRGAAHFNRLAANLGTQFIRCGVRAVVAAGWAVNDSAAEDFSRTFYEQMLDRGESFGAAVLAARRKARAEYPANNTWAAYQCYGDHSFKLRPRMGTSVWGSGAGRRRPFSSTAQAVIELDNIAGEAETASARGQARLESRLGDVQARIPRAWLEEQSDVLVGLGRAWGQLGDFEEACIHLGKALSMEGSDYPVRGIETYANFVVRAAFQRWSSKNPIGGEQGPPEETRECVTEIRKARTLLLQLMSIGSVGQDGERPGATSERLSLMGSAHKRLAVMAGDPAAELAACEGWYEEAMKVARGERVSYPLLNWLYVVAMRKARGETRQSKDFLERLGMAREEAARKDDESPSFFSHVLKGEVKLIEGIWSRGFDADEIMEIYRSAWMRGGSIRSYRSIDEQLDCMERLLQGRPGLAGAVSTLRTRFARLVGQNG